MTQTYNKAHLQEPKAGGQWAKHTYITQTYNEAHLQYPKAGRQCAKHTWHKHITKHTYKTRKQIASEQSIHDTKQTQHKAYNKAYLWPDLRKASCHAHNNKTHFSPSNDRCTCWLTIQPGIDSKSCPGCFCCGLFLRLVRCPRVFWSPSNGCMSPWQADSWL